MMAMTPQDKKALDDIERAFYDETAPRIVTLAPAPAPAPKPKPARRGWFSGFADKLATTFVCCAPPQSLLDDDEIHEILAAIEEPVKPVRALPPRAPSHKDSFLRRNSASVMPASRSLSDSTPALETKTSVAEEVNARPRVSLATMQRVAVTLLALHKKIETRQTERAVLAVQMKWRRRQPTSTAAASTTAIPIAPAPTTAPTPVPTTPTNAAEPDHEPKTVDDQEPAAVSSPKRRRHRLRKTHGNKKTKFDFIPTAATQEATVAVESITELALTRKRLRSIDLESRRTPVVDVERNVHVLFGEEEIDEDNDDEVAELGRMPQPVLSVALQRCASVPPPSTAFCPRPIKSKPLQEAQAASTLQRAWRNTKARRERELQRRVQQHEAETHSVMPTIRDKMTLLRKRLAEMQDRNSSAMVVVDAPAIIAPVDDDYDWL